MCEGQGTNDLCYAQSGLFLCVRRCLAYVCNVWIGKQDNSWMGQGLWGVVWSHFLLDVSFENCIFVHKALVCHQNSMIQSRAQECHPNSMIQSLLPCRHISPQNGTYRLHIGVCNRHVTPDRRMRVCEPTSESKAETSNQKKRSHDD